MTDLTYNILDEFKDTLIKINNDFDIYTHNIILKDNLIKVHYEYQGYFYPHNFLKMYDEMLTSKIYRVNDNLFWGFDPLTDIQANVNPGRTNINFVVPVWTSHFVESYITILPKELVILITEYLGIPDVNTFCVYLQTWDACNEDLYRTMYFDKYTVFYLLIDRYLKYEVNSWYNRYISLLWEEVSTLAQLAYRYRNTRPRSSHLNFILTIYDLLLSPRIKGGLAIDVYNQNKNLLRDVYRNMPVDRQNKFLDEFERLKRIDIILYLG